MIFGCDEMTRKSTPLKNTTTGGYTSQQRIECVPKYRFHLKCVKYKNIKYIYQYSAGISSDHF